MTLSFRSQLTDPVVGACGEKAQHGKGHIIEQNQNEETELRLGSTVSFKGVPLMTYGHH